MTVLDDNDDKNSPAQDVIDELEFCFRKLTEWDQRAISSAALAARVRVEGGIWRIDDVAEAADQLGYDLEPADFNATATDALPEDRLIAATKDGGYLAVLEGSAAAKTWVAGVRLGNDPIEMDHAELMDRLSGRAWVLRKRLTDLELGGADQRRERRGRYGHWFWGPVTRARWLYVQVGLAALLVNVFALTGSVFSMIVYDRVIPNNATDTLTALMIGAAIIFIVIASTFFV